MRLKIPFRWAPTGIKPVAPVDRMIYGQAVPARHYGSVDVFFEALENSTPGGILVIDNGGRQDEACIGDLAVLEVREAGLRAMVVWGLHRDTTELIEIGLPVFSYGSCPAGPSRLDIQEPEALASARFGDFLVTGQDMVFADSDGVVFVESSRIEQVMEMAASIREAERKQVEALSGGENLRQQFQFQEFLKHRESDPELTFRKHLRALSRSIEE